MTARPLDPAAIPCRRCSAAPGQYCRIMTMLGPSDESILFDPHATRVEDARATAKILWASDGDAVLVRSCRETWQTSSGPACAHGYAWACPRGRETDG